MVGTTSTALSPEESTSTTDESFIDAIQKQLDIGFGFVPFIGAGFSAPSGSPLVWDLSPYLQRCIWLALGGNSLQFRPWNPRTDRWPVFNDHANSRDYWTKVYIAHQEATGSRKQILGAALGDMKEWRDSLTFLSRIVAKEPKINREEWTVSLTAENSQVKEDCIRHVLADKNPTLGHRMLARLASSLRLNTVLTTNFDDLLEIAFDDAKNHLEKVPVGVAEPLPAYSSISRSRHIVKMHGDTYSLRLDYSLDAIPSEIDRRTFVDYLTCPSTIHKTDLRSRLNTTDQTTYNHLLVMGVSAADERTTDFVLSAFQDLDMHFQVFWLCHTNDDLKNVDVLKMRIDKHLESTNRTGSKRLTCLRNTHLGLLFLQLFQTLRNTLPTAGVVFPSVSKLALPPSPSPRLEVVPFQASIIKAIETAQDSSAFHRCIVVTSEHDVPGVTTQASTAFSLVENKGNISLWFDMDDISSTEDLFEQLLDAACYRIGLEHWLPSHVSREASAQARAVHDVLLKSNKKWVVFLNLREPPGSNLDDEQVENEYFSSPNGWADDIPKKKATAFEDKTNNAYSLYGFIRQLTLPVKTNEIRGNITLVLLLRRSADGPSHLEKLITEKGRSAVVLKLEKAGITDDAVVNHIVLEAIRWVCKGESSQRLSFLLTLIFSQRIRYLSLIWSRPEWREQASSWLDTFEKMQLIRRKRGGFLWIHSRIRTRIRSIFKKPDYRVSFFHNLEQQACAESEAKQICDYLDKIDICELLADVHLHLASWYKKVLGSTSSPGAVFEAIHHVCEAAKASFSGKSKINKATLSAIAEQISWATSLLSSNSFLIQSQGYSRNSCRRLRQVRDIHCSSILTTLDALGGVTSEPVRNSVATLQIRCYEIMRAIAREVGEDFRAYSRHRKVRLLHHEWCRISKQPQLKPLKMSHTMEAARWWRWSGMLAIASRSYDSSLKAILYSLKWIAVNTKLPFQSMDIYCLIIAVANECQKGGQLSDRSMLSLRVEAARAIEVYIQKELLIVNLSYRLNELSAVNLDSVSDLIDSGLKISNSLYRDHHSESSYNSRAAWLESRFLMHRAILSIYMKDKPNILGILADAESTLRGTVLERGSNYAVVELHRAEILLKQADMELVPVAVGDKKGKRKAKPIAIKDLAEEWHLEYVTRTKAFKDSRFSFTAPATKIRSHVKDANSYIKRAEPILVIRRRSVWWTTWYIQRHLRIVSLSIWTSVLEESETVPFLGPEFASSDRMTLPEQLLFDAISIIRVDAYRLATIVREFAECCVAYMARLINMDRNKPEWVSHRFVELGDSLSAAISALVEVQDRRQAPAPSDKSDDEQDDDSVQKQKEGEQMHPMVTKYIETTLKYAKKIELLINNPIR